MVHKGGTLYYPDENMNMFYVFKQANEEEDVEAGDRGGGKTKRREEYRRRRMRRRRIGKGRI